jgi:membrane-bound lytic murein transglycosylase MltF
MQGANVFQAEIAEIQKYRWLESEKLSYDIGEEIAAVEWIRQYAKSFREYWNRKIQADTGKEQHCIILLIC